MNSNHIAAAHYVLQVDPGPLIHLHACVYTHTHTHTHVRAHTHTQVHTHTHTYTYTYINNQTYTHLQHLEVKYEEEKRKCLNELDAVRKRAADREAAVQKAATKHIDSLTMQVRVTKHIDSLPPSTLTCCQCRCVGCHDLLPASCT